MTSIALKMALGAGLALSAIAASAGSQHMVQLTYDPANQGEGVNLVTMLQDGRSAQQQSKNAVDYVARCEVTDGKVVPQQAEVSSGYELVLTNKRIDSNGSLLVDVSLKWSALRELRREKVGQCDIDLPVKDEVHFRELMKLPGDGTPVIRDLGPKGGRLTIRLLQN